MSTQNTPQNLETLAARLVWARTNARYTQMEVADNSGISRTTYNRLEAGKNKTTGRIVEIAGKLGVSPEWLATGKWSPYTNRVLQIAKLDVDANSYLSDNPEPPLKKWTEVMADKGDCLRFRYRLEGDAMQGGKPNDIPHGAIMEIDPDQAGKPGSIQIADLGGFPAIGVLQQMGPKMYLRPNNKDYQAAEVEPDNLIGAVVGYRVLF